MLRRSGRLLKKVVPASEGKIRLSDHMYTLGANKYSGAREPLSAEVHSHRSVFSRQTTTLFLVLATPKRPPVKPTCRCRSEHDRSH